MTMFLHEASLRDHGMHPPVARSRWLRLGMRLAAGVGAEKAARAEGIEGSAVESLLLDPDFRSLRNEMAVLLGMHEDLRRRKLEEMAFAVLMRALAADDLRAAAYVMASERRGENPSSRLARTFWSRAQASASPAPAAATGPNTADRGPDARDDKAVAPLPGAAEAGDPTQGPMAIDRLPPPPPPPGHRHRRRPEWPAARAMRRGVAALCGELREEVIVRAPDDTPRARSAAVVRADRARAGGWPGAARALEGFKAELLRGTSYGPFFLSRHFDRLRRWYALGHGAMKLGP